jgi:uncharacterized protein (TIGR03118 family)
MLLALAGAAGAREPAFQESDLASNIPGRAAHTDERLQNPWGLAANPRGGWWIADNGAGLATIYDRRGEAASLLVALDGPVSPTGAVFYGGEQFLVADQNGHRGPARFLFATEDGFIEAWSPTVPPPPPSTNGFVMVDRSTAGCAPAQVDCGAVYKGLAIATDEWGETRLYATDFRNRRVDVFSETFDPVDLPFHDDDLPADFAPFGIAQLRGRIFVTYALQDERRHDDQSGAGHGFVDEFDLFGRLLRRVATRGALDSPWGLAVAPDAWGDFEGDLLIGNFGDGRINVYAPRPSGPFSFVVALEDDRHRPIAIDGLWAIVFAPGNAVAGRRDELFFTAGLAHEADGLFGKITRVR